MDIVIIKDVPNTPLAAGKVIKGVDQGAGMSLVNRGYAEKHEEKPVKKTRAPRKKKEEAIESE